MLLKELSTLVTAYPSEYRKAHGATRKIMIKSLLSNAVLPSIDQEESDIIAKGFLSKTADLRNQAQIIVKTALSAGEISASSADLMNHIIDYYFSVSHAERTRLDDDEARHISEMLCEIAESGTHRHEIPDLFSSASRL